MKTTIPEKTVEVCDFCHREGYLTTCDVCNRQYCLTDEGIMAGSFGFTRICTECSHRDDVKKVCERYAEKLTPIYKNRKTALRRLPTSLENNDA